MQPDAIIVLDRAYRVLGSSRPTEIPMLSDFRRFGSEQAALADAIEALQGRDAQTVDLPDARHLYVVVPIADEAAPWFLPAASLVNTELNRGRADAN